MSKPFVEECDIIKADLFKMFHELRKPVAMLFYIIQEALYKPFIRSFNFKNSGFSSITSQIPPIES